MTIVRYAFGSIQIDSKRLEAALASGPQVFYREMRDSMGRLGILFERRMKTEQFAGYRGQSYDDRLQVRTGHTRSSIGHRLAGRTIDTLALFMFGGGNLSYPLAQEFGHPSIRPRRAKFLTVPMKWILTPTGMVRSQYRLTGRGETAGGMKTFIIDSRGRKFVAMRTSASKRSKIRVLYRLMPSVRLPGPSTGAESRLGFERMWFTRMARDQQALMQWALDKTTLALGGKP